MSNSRQELESQNEIVIGLQAIAKQSKELMRQLRRPTGDKNLYNSLGQDIQRAEKKSNICAGRKMTSTLSKRRTSRWLRPISCWQRRAKNPPRWQC